MSQKDIDKLLWNVLPSWMNEDLSKTPMPTSPDYPPCNATI